MSRAYHDNLLPKWQLRMHHALRQWSIAKSMSCRIKGHPRRRRLTPSTTGRSKELLHVPPPANEWADPTKRTVVSIHPRVTDKLREATAAARLRLVDGPVDAPRVPYMYTVTAGNRVDHAEGRPAWRRCRSRAHAVPTFPSGRVTTKAVSTSFDLSW